jgi:hypothetical protein
MFMEPPCDWSHSEEVRKIRTAFCSEVRIYSVIQAARRGYLMTAPTDDTGSDVIGPRIAFAIRVCAAVMIITAMIPVGLLIGMLLFPIFPVFALPLVMGLTSAVKGAKATAAPSTRSAPSMSTHAAVPEAVRA